MAAKISKPQGRGSAMAWAGLGSLICRVHGHRERLCCALDTEQHCPWKFLDSWSPDRGQQCKGNDKAFNACKFARHEAFNNPLSE